MNISTSPHNAVSEKLDKANTVFLFSGQGSQSFNMALELYQKLEVFRLWMDRLDSKVKQLSGRSIVQMLYKSGNDKENKFSDIRFTHPAIFMVEYSLAQSLIEYGLSPDVVVGSSLGEIIAATVANAVTLDQALEFVTKQADLIYERCPASGMLAIIDNVSLYSRSPFINSRSEIAAENFHSHFVISANHKSLLEVEAYLSENKILFQSVPVDQGFHSSLIDCLKDDFLRLSSSLIIHNPSCKFVSCYTTGELKEFNSEYYWNVIRKPILVEKTLTKLENNGSNIYIDVGPSGTLATFAKYIVPEKSKCNIYPILTPFGNDLNNFEKVITKFGK